MVVVADVAWLLSSLYLAAISIDAMNDVLLSLPTLPYLLAIVSVAHCYMLLMMKLMFLQLVIKQVSIFSCLFDFLA